MVRAGVVVGLALVLGACDPDYGVADGGREPSDGSSMATDGSGGDEDEESADSGEGGSDDDGADDDGAGDDGSNDDGSNDDGASDDGSNDDGSSDDGSNDDGASDDGPGGASDGGDASVFENDVVPIFSARCGCHTDGSPSAGLDLSPGAAYDALVGVSSSAALDYVTPGSAADSYLVHKMQGTHGSVAGGGGSTMPPGAGSIPGEEIDTIIAWIEDGAL